MLHHEIAASECAVSVTAVQIHGPGVGESPRDTLQVKWHLDIYLNTILHETADATSYCKRASYFSFAPQSIDRSDQYTLIHGPAILRREIKTVRLV